MQPSSKPHPPGYNNRPTVLQVTGSLRASTASRRCRGIIRHERGSSLTEDQHYTTTGTDLPRAEVRVSG